MKHELSVPGILKHMAATLQTEIVGNRLEIPESRGSGYCAGYVFGQELRLTISHYELWENMVLQNPEVNSGSNRLFFKFMHIFPQATVGGAAGYVPQLPSVLIATSRLNADRLIEIHSNTATINIEVDTDYLRNVLHEANQSSLLQSLLDNKRPLLFEQLLYPSLQKVVDDMLQSNTSGYFEYFFLRIKTEELICRLLTELCKRDEQKLYPLNETDVQALYRIRQRMLDAPGNVPNLSDLAEKARMSPTKLKRLFKQVFGNSIFSYYQEFRMKEAARMLTDEKRSVADTGYLLGFSNLSHFARVFEAHTGLKPKQYAKQHQNETPEEYLQGF